MSVAPTPPAPARPKVVIDAKWVAIFILGGIAAWPTVAPYIPKPDPWVSLGRSYRHDAAVAYATGWEAGASALESGKSMGDSQAAFQSAWFKARADAFAAKVAPKLSAILPEGAEPTDAQRPQVVAAWRSLAKGLRAK